jgi:hypothetical protein
MRLPFIDSDSLDCIYQRKKCSLMKKEETPYIVPIYSHFLAVWTKIETFYFQYFVKKKRKSADQRKTFISDIHNVHVVPHYIWTRGREKKLKRDILYHW